MKLSSETLDLLKNFAEINMSILVKAGKTLKTVSPQKTVLAVATIKENMPQEFAIYDLKQLLGTISLFGDPDLDFKEKNVKISNGTGAEAYYIYAAKEAIVCAPDKDVHVNNPEISFSLEKNAFSSARAFAGVLGLPNIAFIGEKGKVFLSTIDAVNNSAHSWRTPVGECKDNYRMVFRLENLKFLSRDYDVVISSKGVARFASKNNDVTYYVSTETTSKYGP